MTSLSLAPPSPAASAARETAPVTAAPRAAAPETVHAPPPIERKRAAAAMPERERYREPAGPAPAFDVTVLQDIQKRMMEPPHSMASAPQGEPVHALDQRL